MASPPSAAVSMSAAEKVARRTGNVQAACDATWARLQPSALRAQGRCERCCMSTPSDCLCAVLAPLPCPHKVTVLLHHLELGRGSSTHRLLLLGLRSSEACVWNSASWPSASDVWAHAQADCASSGRVPCFLFPSPDALTVPALHAAMTPAQRAAGLHVIVLDGTWGNARGMLRDIPPAARKVVIQPPALYTLFSPLRTQPSPGKVSTLEAVAALFDEFACARRGEAYSAGAAGGAHAEGGADDDGDGDGVDDDDRDGDGAAAAAASKGGSVGVEIIDGRSSSAANVEVAAVAAGEGGGVNTPPPASDAPRSALDAKAPLASTMPLAAVAAAPVVVEDEEDETGGEAEGLTSATALLSLAAPLPNLAAPPGAASSTLSVADLLIRSGHSAYAAAGARKTSVRGPCAWASRLRQYLMAHVDAIAMRKLACVDPDGTGYRSWWLGPSAGAFACVPAWVLTHIAEFAYGRARVRPDGYTGRRADGCAQWREIEGEEGAAAGGAGRMSKIKRAKEAAAAAKASTGAAATPATADAAGGAAASPSICSTSMKPGAAGAVSATAASSAAAGEARRRPAAAPQAAEEGGGSSAHRLPARAPSGPGPSAAVTVPKRVRGRARFHLPENRAYLTPLAATCSEMLCLAAGRFYGSWRAPLPWAALVGGGEAGFVPAATSASGAAAIAEAPPAAGAGQGKVRGASARPPYVSFFPTR